MDWRKILSAKAPAIPDLEQNAQDLRTESAAALATIARLQAARRQVLLTGTDDALAQHDEQAAAARRAHDRALAAIEEVDARLADARARQVAVARQAAYDVAGKQVDAARARLRKDYPTVVAAMRGILREIAEAEMLRAAVNADLPDGAAPLPSPEDFRQSAFEPQAEASRRRVTRWVDKRNGRMIPDNMQATLDCNGGNANSLPQPYNGLIPVRRAFDEVATLPQRGLPPMAPLASSVRLPALDREHHPGFEPADHPLGFATDQPAAVLALLVQLDMPHPGVPPRMPEITLELVPIALVEREEAA